MILMNNDSVTTVVGNLTRDPHIAYTAVGHSVCNFTVAINNPHKSATFMPVAVFGKQADHCKASLRKGTRVIVSGRTDVSEWVDSDGVGRQQTQLFASHVGLSLQFTTGEAHPRERTITTADREAARMAKSLGMEWDEGQMRWVQVRPSRNEI